MTFQPHVVYKVDKYSMQVVEVYFGTYDAAVANEKKPSFVAQVCIDKTLTRDRWFYRYEEDYDDGESFEGKLNRPVAVYDSKAKVAGLFPCAQAAAKAAGVATSTMTHAIKKKTVIRDRFIAKYLR